MAEKTWCPQCGPGVAVDESKCCRCGSVAVGPGADAALKKLGEAERLRVRYETLQDMWAETVLSVATLTEERDAATARMQALDESLALALAELRGVDGATAAAARIDAARIDARREKQR